MLLAASLIKSGSSLLGDMARITRGPGRFISRMLQHRPLIGAGLDNLQLPGMAGKAVGDLRPQTFRNIVAPNAALKPMMAQQRNTMAQYLRSAKPKFEHFSGAPEFYPESQFREAPLPGGGRQPIRLDGYMGPGQQWLTSWYRKPGVGPGVTPFAAGSTGVNPTGQPWHGLHMPDFPSPEAMQAGLVRNPKPSIAFTPRQS